MSPAVWFRMRSVPSLPWKLNEAVMFPNMYWYSPGLNFTSTFEATGPLGVAGELGGTEPP